MKHKIIKLLLFIILACFISSCDLIGINKHTNYHEEKIESKFVEITKDEFIAKFNEEHTNLEYCYANIEVNLSEEVTCLGYTYKKVKGITNFAAKNYRANTSIFFYSPNINGPAFGHQSGIHLPIIQSADPTSIFEEKQYKVFKNPYSIEFDKTKIIYTKFMLPSSITTINKGVEMNIQFKYFNEDSVKGLRGNIEKDDYMNYMYIKTYSKNTKSLANFTFSAKGHIFWPDSDEILFLEYVAGEVKGHGEMIPHMEGLILERRWVTSKCIYEIGNNENLVHSKLMADSGTDIYYPFHTLYFSNLGSQYIEIEHEYTFNKKEITVRVNAKNEERNVSIIAIFDKEGYIKEYNETRQKEKDLEYTLKIIYQFV